MNLDDLMTKGLTRVNPKLAARSERYLRRIPAVRARMDREYDRIMSGIEGSLKPYRGQVQTFAKLPERGRPREEILAEMQDLSAREKPTWHEGRVSGAVYQGDDQHVEFLNRVYAANSQVNPLHADLWPSATKYDAEVVAMTASMLGAEAAMRFDPKRPVCGTVTSGGTESIVMAMKTYRDWARETKRIRRPEIVAPTTAHVAFDKAAHYFGIKLVRVPVGRDFRADVARMRAAITNDTIALVGSAPAFPHGTIDAIEALSETAREHGLGFHTDACLGGFILPWARRLGYPVPAFDFSLPGVTSMSADTHKFGLAAKGTSVVLYRGTELRSFQYFATTEWPGGFYFSPTMAGSRPGGLSAACWAAMISIGEEGYLEASGRILEAAATIREGAARVPGVRVVGDGLFVVAMTTHPMDPYRVMDMMTKRGWHLIGLQKPAGFHICVTLRQTLPGVAERFVEDLQSSVAEARDTKPTAEGMAPVYGMAATIPFRGMVRDMLKRYMDLLYKV
jgi:sphinganine-1-phosphate aldolase